ncbi:MAG: hypothetical protein LUE14_05350 [Clostridiales bacterium]|nr:hypothetical protein [Clostridiales bacterium]
MKWFVKNKMWVLNNLIWGGMAAAAAVISFLLAAVIPKCHGWVLPLALCGKGIFLLSGCLCAGIAVYAAFVLVYDFARGCFRKLGSFVRGGKNGYSL